MEPQLSSGRRRRRTVLVLLLCFMALIPLSSAASGMRISRQKLEVQKHLKRLNKQAVQSIKSPDGDIIDCVHMAHQPAFDHPFLKNHTIQLRPNFHPEGLYDESKVSTRPKDRPRTITQLWHLNGRCPEGTIPIRRTKKEDILRASSVKRFGKKKHRTIPKPTSADPDLINESGHQVRKKEET
uniref:Neprosin activation peptide domain-containing protein n=1 Tax=Nelumbo nucifera TaxID=4432 RepID=A0A822ZFA1_NELNU|nr:TPA_asm: hypothetical protein HUJ06_000315 [Nelumbo nucifera]